MTGDDRLRTELGALERAAPTGDVPVVEAARPRPWGRIGLIGATVVAAAAVTSLAFGLGGSLDVGSRSSSPNPSGPPPNPPAAAETRVGDFILTISSPKTIWTTDEKVEVSAGLTYVGDQPDMTIGQGIPPIMFTVARASGEGPTLGGAQLQPCAPYRVNATEPVSAAFRGGGLLAVEGGQPVEPAPPYDQIIADDGGLHLPTGDWELTAYTSFDERGCGDDYQLEVSIVLQVRATWHSPEPSPDASGPDPSPTGPVRVCAAALAHGVLDADAAGNPILIVEGLPPIAIVFSYPEDYVIESKPVLTIYDRDGSKLAREGDEVELGGGFNAGDTIFHACGVVSSDSYAADTEVNAAGIHAVLPPGWTYRLPTFVSWGPAKPVIYFSNQLMHDECSRVGNSETCDRPINELVPDGVLIEWWASGDYPFPTPRPLPSGAPYELDGLHAVRHEGDVGLCGLQTTQAEAIVVRRSDLARDELTICSRDLTPATRAELEDLLASIEFEGTPSD